MKSLIIKYFTRPLYCKELFWGKSLRIFCDGGNPTWRWVPKFYKAGYAEFWGLSGFWVNFWGRQIFFSFGEDKKGLYKTI